MDRRTGLVVFRVGFALLTTAAIATQLIDLANKGTLNPVNFFSYFTIQSNVLGIVAFLIVAARWRSPRSRRVEMFRGQTVLMLTVTLIVFALLLSGTDVDTAIPWVNAVLHQVFPVAIIADWLIDPPASPISLRGSLWWLAFPLLWAAYTFIRGAIVGWYPYPFLDPANGGYVSVAGYLIAILIFGAILSAVVAWLGTTLRRRLGSAAVTATSTP